MKWKFLRCYSTVLHINVMNWIVRLKGIYYGWLATVLFFFSFWLCILYNHHRVLTFKMKKKRERRLYCNCNTHRNDETWITNISVVRDVWPRSRVSNTLFCQRKCINEFSMKFMDTRYDIDELDKQSLCQFCCLLSYAIWIFSNQQNMSITICVNNFWWYQRTDSTHNLYGVCRPWIMRGPNFHMASLCVFGIVCRWDVNEFIYVICLIHTYDIK